MKNHYSWEDNITNKKITAKFNELIDLKKSVLFMNTSNRYYVENICKNQFQ